MNAPSKGYISQLPLAVGLASTDYCVIDQLVNGAYQTRRAPLNLVYPVATPPTPAYLNINNQVGTTYALTLADYPSVLQPFNTLVRMNNAGAMTVTIPLLATVAYGIGVQVLFERTGAGTLTIVGAGGVTIRNASSNTARVQNSIICLINEGADSWVLCGDLT